MPKSLPQPWYQAGLRFECQQCAKCCVNHGEYTHVYVSLSEERRLARQLKIGLKAFRDGFTEKLKSGHRVLLSTDEACIFLDGKSCGVYDARPTQCATWPFWPESMNERVWHDEVAPFCPGVGRGRLHTREEIDELVDQTDAGEEP